MWRITLFYKIFSLLINYYLLITHYFLLIAAWWPIFLLRFATFCYQQIRYSRGFAADKEKVRYESANTIGLAGD